MRIIKTVGVVPNSNHYHVIMQLMAKVQLKEVSRSVTGGHMSQVELYITFEGNDDYWKLFEDDIYIKLPYDSVNDIYYSLRLLNGYTTKYFNAFKAAHQNGLPSFQLLRFSSNE